MTTNVPTNSACIVKLCQIVYNEKGVALSAESVVLAGDKIKFKNNKMQQHYLVAVIGSNFLVYSQ